MGLEKKLTWRQDIFFQIAGLLLVCVLVMAALFALNGFKQPSPVPAPRAKVAVNSSWPVYNDQAGLVSAVASPTASRPNASTTSAVNNLEAATTGTPPTRRPSRVPLPQPREKPDKMDLVYFPGWWWSTLVDDEDVDVSNSSDFGSYF